MHDLNLLTDGVAIFGLGLLAAWMFRLLGAPSVIGYLVAGLIIGPSGLDWVHQEDVESLTEFGLILLLFIIGIELSPSHLASMGKSLLVAAAVQIGTTVVLVAGIAGFFLGFGVQGSLIIGMVVALSSTAIVLKQISDRGEVGTPFGRMTTGILIIQDIAVIVVMLLLPFLAIGGEGEWFQQLLPSFIGLVVLVVLFIAGRSLLAQFIKRVLYPGGPEFVALFAVVAAFGGAWLAGLVGWSLPLGACIAGLLLSEADARHRIASDVIAQRDVFNALFFISLGMLVDVDVAVANAGFLAAAIAATIVGKSIITSTAVRISGWPLVTSIQVGLGLSMVSEFGYVLAHEANNLSLITDDVLTLTTVYVLGTMFFGAMLVPVTRPLASRIAAFGSGEVSEPVGESTEETSAHVILCGFGTSGQNLARALKATHIPFEVIEINPTRVTKAEEAGVPATMGDASRYDILQHSGIKRAEAVVIAINDVEATARVIASARRAREDIYILADTYRVSDIDRLYKLGASEVLAQDFESSIETAAHILRRMDIPDNIIAAQLTALRSGRYSMLRGMPTDHRTSEELLRALQLTATRTHYIELTSPTIGQTLRELNLRAQSGATIIAVVRNGNPNTNPGADFVLEGGDVLVLVGAHTQLDKAGAIIDGSD